MPLDDLNDRPALFIPSYPPPAGFGSDTGLVRPVPPAIPYYLCPGIQALTAFAPGSPLSVTVNIGRVVVARLQWRDHPQPKEFHWFRQSSIAASRRPGHDARLDGQHTGQCACYAHLPGGQGLACAGHAFDYADRGQTGRSCRPGK